MEVLAGRLSLTHSTMAPIHDAANNGDLDALAREIGNGVSPDLSYGQGGLVPIHLVITNNFITNNDGVVDYGDLDNRLACIRASSPDRCCTTDQHHCHSLRARQWRI